MLKNNIEIKLTQGQKKAYDLIEKGKNIFLTGSGGTGKTFLLKKFINSWLPRKNLGVTSTTGVSSLLLGGTTLHSFLGIGLGNGSIEYLYDKIYDNYFLRNRWCKLKILIIDEISMLSLELFEKLELLARHIRDNNLPFGGVQLILSGDFLQLPTVKSDHFCFESKRWDKCVDKVVYLKEIIRQQNKEFQICLNNIRIGSITDDVKKFLNKCVNNKLINKNGIRPTKLFSTNYMVDKINNEELDKFTNDDIQFYEYEMDIKFSNNIKSKNYSHIGKKYKKNCSAPEIIQLCIGCQVMLLHNLDLEGGLVNGSRGVIINFIENYPLVKFLNGREIVIDNHIWDIKDGNKQIMTIIQLPLRLAYALTAHKIQGSSLDYAEMDLSNVFEYGQAYVMLSRVQTSEGLHLINIDYDKIKASPRAISFYKQLEE